ncbi:MAG TPA: type II secretion system protein [Gallionella sp.]|nr:type II secretion system protein [Gallionella sp.]
MRWRRAQSGFTLVEMIMVIVITGIIGALAAMFLKAPVQQYLDIARRAEMTDIADTALRRIGRDLRTAVPNSLRLPTAAGSTYLEFLPTSAGARYRTGEPGDILDFTIADSSFDVIGQVTFAAGDHIVLGSTQSDGNPPYDSTTAGVRRAYTGTAGTKTNVAIAGAAQFPAFAEVPGHRFVVVPGDQQAVTYACENVGITNGEGTGTLKRYWHYGFNTTQAAPPLSGSNAILADKVSSCNIVYDVANQRNGLVAITLGITRGGESISLYHEIHVNNVP